MKNITEISKNVYQIDLSPKKAEVAVLSDIHWDNPKCNRKLLKKHLDYCVSNDLPIVIIGDLFCLMQGRGDNRRNKSDILPEHNNAQYLDSIVDTAVEWWGKYVNNIAVIGYGNHETGIIKYQETDILKRFIDKCNLVYGSNIKLGGYGGWLIYSMTTSSNTNTKVSFKHKYFHGSGGGGIVTKGAINLTRALETYEGYDLFTMGHIHENASRTDTRETIYTNAGKVKIIRRDIHSCITGTYKEEYGLGEYGWHVERGAPPKTLGGRIITFEVEKNPDGLGAEKKIDSRLFPL